MHKDDKLKKYIAILKNTFPIFRKDSKKRLEMCSLNQI